jgi:zinc protease
MNRLILILTIVIFLPSSSRNSREIGDFVKDLKITPLEFTFPMIERLKLNRSGELLSLTSNFFPMTEMEIHIYKSEEDKTRLEIPSLLFGTWKLGGTEKLPDSKFVERLEFLGATFELIPGYEKSILTLSFLNRDESEIFSLLNEWIHNPRITDENFVTIKSQMKEAILRRNDNVTNIGMRKSKELLFGKRLRGRVETLESLDQITKQDLITYHKEFISTNKLNITLAGSGDPKKILEKCNQVFPLASKSISEKNSLELNYNSLSQEFTSLGKEIHLIEKQTNQSMVLILGIMPPHNHPDFYAIQLLNYIIGGGGFNSYFMTEIRNNRGLAYSSNSSVSFDKDYGIFYAYTLTKNESVGEVYKLMGELLSMETIGKIQEHELVRAQNAIVNQFVFLFENNQKILANQIRFDDHNMPQDYLKTYRDHITKVKLEDLKRVGKEYFQENRFRTILVGPKDLTKQLSKEKFIIKNPEERIR